MYRPPKLTRDINIRVPPYAIIHAPRPLLSSRLKTFPNPAIQNSRVLGGNHLDTPKSSLRLGFIPISSSPHKSFQTASMAGESSAGRTRTPSRVSHRDSPMGSRRSTPAPPPLHLSMMRDFLSQTVLLTNLSKRMVPTPSDYSLSEFSDGEAIIIPLLCRTLEALGATNERIDILTTTVENLELNTPSQPAHPPPHPPPYPPALPPLQSPPHSRPPRPPPPPPLPP